MGQEVYTELADSVLNIMDAEIVRIMLYSSEVGGERCFRIKAYETT